ncbi:hypothetical protein C8R45DRAFT_1033324 [Mycena sanguinolenta]|nr:hypothetical protein C8R45DRAFT_1033324 [Mycena sanguinolenta]
MPIAQPASRKNDRLFVLALSLPRFFCPWTCRSPEQSRCLDFPLYTTFSLTTKTITLSNAQHSARDPHLLIVVRPLKVAIPAPRMQATLLPPSVHRVIHSSPASRCYVIAGPAPSAPWQYLQRFRERQFDLPALSWLGRAACSRTTSLTLLL